MRFNEQNIAIWTEEYNTFLKSGMGTCKWCESQGISTSTFYYRLDRIKKFQHEEFIASNNIPVFSATQNTTTMITVRSNGLSVIINDNASAEIVNMAIKAVKSC